jgi:2-dehydropantoate 2-reductase
MARSSGTPPYVEFGETTMKIAIFGAGAIGGMMGVKLAQAGADVTFIARGAHLAAMQQNGVTMHSGGETIVVRPRCVGSSAEAGLQDYVIVTLKAHSLPAAAPDIASMMGPDSALITGVNGVPYWYFHALPGPFEGRIVQSVDPGGAVSALLPPGQAIGCVVYPAAEVTAPGVIEHSYGDRFSLGEPDGLRSPRVEAISKLLIEAGLKAPVRPRIRDEIWVKLWGNLCFNPLSALTGATLDVLAGRPDLRAVARSMMIEAQGVAEALGVKFAISVDKRIEGAAEVGAHKTSMLQDLERSRPMEIDALLGAVVELGALVGQSMPICESILALVRQRAREAGCYTSGPWH